MSTKLDLSNVRSQVSEIIHSLGFVLEYCVCADANGKHVWPAQVADDLENAKEMATQVVEFATTLDLYVGKRARAAKRVAAHAGRKASKKGGAK